MERILVIRFGSLGDVVMAGAVIESLSRMKDKPRIVFLTKKTYAPLYDCDPRIERVLGVDRNETPGSIARSAGEGFDAVIDLHGTLRSMAVSALVRAPLKTRVNKHGLARRFMVWSRNSLRRRFDVLGSYLNTLSPLGCTARVLPRLHAASDALDSADRVLAAFRKKDGCLIGLAPGSRHPSKRWDTSYWATLADTIASGGDVPLILGDRDDRDFVLEIQRFANTAIPSLAGEVDLRTTMGIIARLDLLVTNDSGPMHIAGALGTSSVSIFGPTHPALGFVPGYPFCTILHAGLPCSPCSLHGEAPCRMAGRPCMTRISPEMVYAEIERKTAFRKTARPDDMKPC